MARVLAQMAYRANSQSGKHPWKLNCPLKDATNIRLLAGIECLPSALVGSLRDAVVAHFVGKMEDEGLNI